MKKKILTLMLAFAFIIPCMLGLTACGKDKDKHNHNHNIQGVCECGHYLGTTKENDGQTTFQTIAVGETKYVRYKLEANKHYDTLTNANSAEIEIKFYAKYNNAYREQNLDGTGGDIDFYEILPQDGYMYVVVKNISDEVQETVAVALLTTPEGHYGATVYDGPIDLDAEFEGGQHYCYKLEAEVGRYLIYTKSDFVSFPTVLDEAGNKINSSLEKQGGNYYLEVTEAQDIFFHFYCNTEEDSTDSHFTIQKVGA